jgi:hypothetical protein
MYGEAKIKLAELRSVPAAQSPAGGFEDATGIRWLTLETDDLAGVVERCTAAGASFPMPSQQSPRTAGLFFAIVADPDGNWVEMFQAPTSE